MAQEEELDLDDILSSALDDMDNEEPQPAPSPAPAPAPAVPKPADQSTEQQQQAMLTEIMGAISDPEKMKSLLQEAGIEDGGGQLVNEEFKMICDALSGLDVADQGAQSGGATGGQSGAGNTGAGDENIAETLKMMQDSMGELKDNLGAAGAGGNPLEGLESLLGNMSEEEKKQVEQMLESLQEGGEEGFQKVVQNMMGQMLSPEILSKPMSDASAAYEKVLSDGSLSSDDRARFQSQRDVVRRVNQELHAEPSNPERVGELLQELQSFGELPEPVAEAMGDGSEAFKGLPGGEGMPPDCCVM